MSVKELPEKVLVLSRTLSDTHQIFSTKPQGEGTGLGLSIIHGIVENHVGRLWFERVEGMYTKAVIDLPVNGSQPLYLNAEP